MKTADRYIRLATLVTVVCIAAFAAIISYQHIYDVSRAHGQSLLDAKLMPLATDGLITAAILSSFYTTRRGLPVPVLARFALILGIIVTIGANSLFGLKYGILGAVISSWPAISFVVAAELSIHTVRITVTGGRSRARASRGSQPSAARSWARDNGYEVNARGRLPADVADAYAEAGQAESSQAMPEPESESESEPATNGNGHFPGQLTLYESEHA